MEIRCPTDESKVAVFLVAVAASPPASSPIPHEARLAAITDANAITDVGWKPAPVMDCAPVPAEAVRVPETMVDLNAALATELSRCPEAL